MLNLRNRLATTPLPPTSSPSRPALTPIAQAGAQADLTPPPEAAVTSNNQDSPADADPLVTIAPAAGADNAAAAVSVPAQAASSSSATRVTDNARLATEAERNSPAMTTVRPRPRDEACTADGCAAGASSGPQLHPANCGVSQQHLTAAEGLSTTSSAVKVFSGCTLRLSMFKIQLNTT